MRSFSLSSSYTKWRWVQRRPRGPCESSLNAWTCLRRSDESQGQSNPEVQLQAGNPHRQVCLLPPSAKTAAIAKQRTSIKGRLGYLFITSVDPQGTHVKLLYHPPPTDEAKELQLEFDPPLKSPWDFEPRMATWGAEAKKHYQIVRFSLTPESKSAELGTA